MPDCKTCHKPFEDFGELAKHILDDQKHHDKYSIKWARTYQMRRVMKAPKPIERQPVTEQMKDNRESCIRDNLSGRQKIVQTYCSICKRVSRESVEEEFAENPLAWRVNNILVKNCENCQSKNRRSW